MSNGEPVSLFPLKTVLFPGGLLPLKIFEPRYVDMVGRSLRENERFGVLAIVAGSEVGPAKTVGIGTTAEIVDWRREPDGLLGITVFGRDRFETGDMWMREDGLYVGRIRILRVEPHVDVPDDYRDLARLLRRVLATGAGSLHVVEAYDDASWVGYRLAELLPLTLEDKQECLEMEDAVARLAKLRAAIERVTH